MINWQDPKSKLSTHFTVHEALYLPSWQIHHIPSEEEKVNILKTVEKMEKIREYLGHPISVHVWMRPEKVNNPSSDRHGQSYNAFIGGSPHSAHINGLAVDFDVVNMSIDDAKAKLLIKLKDFNIRCESDTTSWVHIDLMPPNPNRYFKSK